MSTTSGDSPAATTGWDEHSSQAWLNGGTNEGHYEPAWRLAAMIAEDDAPAAPTVLDIGSGPGGFLATTLEVLPNSQGIWLDNFKTMENEARTNLAGLGDRVQYVLGDLLEVDRLVPVGTVYLATSSRATHHLEPEGLAKFYAGVFSALAPGGWVANLDSMGEGPWRARFRDLRRRSDPTFRSQPNHPPGHPYSAADHINDATAAGFTEVAPVWQRGQHTVIMGRKPS